MCTMFLHSIVKHFSFALCLRTVFVDFDSSLILFLSRQKVEATENQQDSTKEVFLHYKQKYWRIKGDIHGKNAATISRDCQA